MVCQMKKIASQFVDQSIPPQSQWSTEQIPDMTSKVVIVTGANTGIGKETAKALLEHNAKVYIAARNQEKAVAAIQDLREQTGKEAHFLKLNLADLPSVKAAAQEFLNKETQLHVLFNNGGVMIPPISETTAQNYDLQFGTNVLGHFYFTKLLLPVLISTAQSSPEKTVRVVNTSSLGHIFANTVDFNTLKDGPKRKKLGTQRLYIQSKFGNVVFAAELHRRYHMQGIVATSCNPGNLKTDLQRNAPKVSVFLLKGMLFPAPYGALTQLRAGTADEGREWGGKYLIPWARIGEPNPATQDPELGKELWTWLEEQVKDL